MRRVLIATVGAVVLGGCGSSAPSWKQSHVALVSRIAHTLEGEEFAPSSDIQAVRWASTEKKLDNHIAAVAIHFMHYNFARPHKSLANPYPRTPAMAIGVADHVWTPAEIAELAA